MTTNMKRSEPESSWRVIWQNSSLLRGSPLSPMWATCIQRPRNSGGGGGSPGGSGADIAGGGGLSARRMRATRCTEGPRGGRGKYYIELHASAERNIAVEKSMFAMQRPSQINDMVQLMLVAWWSRRWLGSLWPLRSLWS